MFEMQRDLSKICFYHKLMTLAFSYISDMLINKIQAKQARQAESALLVLPQNSAFRWESCFFHVRANRTNYIIVGIKEKKINANVEYLNR